MGSNLKFPVGSPIREQMNVFMDFTSWSAYNNTDFNEEVYEALYRRFAEFLALRHNEDYNAIYKEILL